MQTINEVKAVLALSEIAGVSFVSLVYTNRKDEKSCYTINVGASIENAKKKDIETLENLSFEGIKEEARVKLLEALKSPQKNQSKAQKEAYEHLCSGVKMHKESEKLYIFGLVAKKTVMVEGEAYNSTDTRRPLTKAKDSIRKEYMKSSKYRQFILDASSLEKASVMGDTIFLSK